MTRLITALVFAAFTVCAQPDLMTSYAIKKDVALSADPTKPHWKKIKGVQTTDRFGNPVPGASHTEIRSIWSPENLYFLFINKYETQHLKANPSKTEETWGIWDYDVSEVFIGEDLNNINLYKEFEVTPQGEWIDLDVVFNKKPQSVDWKWNSGFKTENRVDTANKIWYCEMQIPWKSIAQQAIKAGREFRLNLYRIEGSGEGRKFMAWRPVMNPSFHTPSKFGRLILSAKKN